MFSLDNACELALSLRSGMHSVIVKRTKAGDYAYYVVRGVRSDAFFVTLWL